MKKEDDKKRLELERERERQSNRQLIDDRKISFASYLTGLTPDEIRDLADKK